MPLGARCFPPWFPVDPAGVSKAPKETRYAQPPIPYPPNAAPPEDHAPRGLPLPIGPMVLVGVFCRFNMKAMAPYSCGLKLWCIGSSGPSRGRAWY